MRILIVRHAEALAEPSLADDARPLSDAGRAGFERAVRGLGRLGVELDLLLHSPLLRAVQTADLLEPLLRGQRQAVAELTEEPSPRLLAHLHGASAALVGHEPWLSALATWLLTGRRELGPALALQKGGVLWLEGEPRPGGAALLAALPQAVLEHLA